LAKAKIVSPTVRVTNCQFAHKSAKFAPSVFKND